MKRLHGREMALLCSPLLIVATVGWFVSKLRAEDSRLHLVFHVEKPTILEAFGGSDAALVVDLAGPKAGLENDEWRVWRADPFLEVQTTSGTHRSDSSQSSSELWGHVWHGSVNSTRFPINSRAIPAGTLRFGLNAALWSAPLGSSGKMPHLSRVWTVDRSLLKPFSLSQLPRQPYVVLRSATVGQRNPGNVIIDVVFDLQGPGMNAKTSFTEEMRRDILFSGPKSGWTGTMPATQRVRGFGVAKPMNFGGPVTSLVAPSGRVSADNRWPLAFQIEPFDFAKVKVGQKLKFKSWPAPVPKT